MSQTYKGQGCQNENGSASWVGPCSSIRGERASSSVEFTTDRSFARVYGMFNNTLGSNRGSCGLWSNKGGCGNSIAWREGEEEGEAVSSHLKDKGIISRGQGCFSSVIRLSTARFISGHKSFFESGLIS